MKLGVLIGISALIWINRETGPAAGEAGRSVSKGVYFALSGLTLTNVIVAVFWT